MKRLKVPDSIKNHPYVLYSLLIIVFLFHVLFPSMKPFMYLSVHLSELSFFNYLYFLHHENWLHLINNLILYFVFTCLMNLKPMKPHVPIKNQLSLFIITSLLTAILFQITYHLDLHEKTEYLVGASGGIYGVIGFSVLRVLLSIKKLIQVKYMALFLIVFVYLCDQLKIDWLTAENGSIYVHLGGFLMGAIYGICFHCRNKSLS